LNDKWFNKVKFLFLGIIIALFAASLISIFRQW